MTYYRVIFRTAEDGITEWTNIIEAEMSDDDFEKMNWDKPIIRHVMHNQTHFLALDDKYLDAMILGIQTFKDHDKSSSPQGT